jgi:hypothetical protein
MISLLFFMFFLQQSQRTRGWTRFCPEVGVGGRGEVAQIMYAHVSKCKNDKIKFKKRRNNPEVALSFEER